MMISLTHACGGISATNRIAWLAVTLHLAHEARMKSDLVPCTQSARIRLDVD